MRKFSNPSSLLLKEKAYFEIKSGIIHDIFKPGQFLSEKQLIDHLGMSKTPIKAALERLETERFITVSPKQGIMVNELSIEKISNLYDLRIALELFVVEELSGKLREEQIREIELNLDQTNELAHSGDVKGFAEIDAKFHLLLCEFLDNEEIFRVMENYCDLLYRVVLRVLKREPERMHCFYEDHRKIFKSLFALDKEVPRRLMKEHILYGKRISI